MILENDDSFCIKLPCFFCFYTLFLNCHTDVHYSQCRSLTLVKDLIIQTFLARQSALPEKQKLPIFLSEFMKISLTMV